MDLKKTFKGKKVIVTGHTGFKGSWLTLWLTILGAKVVGISVNNPTVPSHYKILNLKNKIKSYNIDIRNIKKLKKIILSQKPQFFFHLAAQSLVNKSFENPINTWQTNTLGTINILESLRKLKNNCVAVIITSDKVYKNFEIKRGYKENDRLGGIDPYSASKASAELALQSYVKSFFSKNNKVRIGIARAGNVIGGGDWSNNRLIPDCVKFCSKNKKVKIRNPNSTRPWQHVLEALYGYLTLAIFLKKKKYLHGESFNFGPNSSVERKVITVIKEMKTNWSDIKYIIGKNKKNFESKLLKLNSLKSKKILKWKCVLSFQDTIELTTVWYKNYYENKINNYLFSKNQVMEYEQKIKTKK